MKKSSYHLKDLESISVFDTELITETRSSDYSLTELAEDDDYGILTDDEENIHFDGDKPQASREAVMVRILDLQ